MRQGHRAAITGLLWALVAGPLLADDAFDARRIPLDPRDVAARTVGSLTFLAGFQLDGIAPGFGGLSSLAIEPDGGSLIAVGDRGIWVEIALQHDADGRLTGLGRASLHRLLGADGAPLSTADRDAEGLTRLADGGYAVSFEHRHRIDLYPQGLGGPARLFVPQGALPRMLANEGLEAIAALPDGRLVALVEAATTTGLHAGYVIAPDGTLAGFPYQTQPDFKPTDLARLPDGDLLVLERSASLVFGFAARLVRVSFALFRPGSVLIGTELGVVRPPNNVDNFEGLAVRADAAGGTLVYILSDDNFNPLQRTLLLQFRLD
ncbi:MAG: esterase-like activity of phytase family protein [Alphaproteobacteria bacterium]|nr:esterase-like activity of phytase family protein [Alphaproteobacteria bacterium]